MIGTPKGRIFASKSYSSKKQLSVALVVIMMPRNRGGGGGKFRVPDDTAVSIGADVQVRAEHVTALNTTKKKESSVEMGKGHRRCLKKMILGGWQSIQSTLKPVLVFCL
jgi:hypothetical protein